MRGNSPRLVVTASQIEELRSNLIPGDNLEHLSVGYCSESGEDRLLVEEIRFLDGEDYEVQTGRACRADLDLEHEMMSECRDRGMHPFIVHSHWFQGNPSFSPTDRQIIPGLHRFVNGLSPESTVVFGVLGERGIDTARFDPDSEQFDPVPVDVLGEWTLDPAVITPDFTEPETPGFEHERVDRSILAFTEAGQRKLAETHVGVIGAGGLGSIVAEELALTGIGEITVVDPDLVELSNRNRLFGAYDYHVGRPKVDAIEEHLYRVNPDIAVNTIEAKAQDAADALKHCDILVGGVDRMSARMWLNQFAVRHLVPYVDAGVVIETTEGMESEARKIDCLEGYIQFVAPGVTACFSCLDRGDPQLARREQLSEDELQEELERGYIDEADLSPEPAVAPLNGVVASKTVLLVSKWVTGYATPEHWIRFEDIGNKLDSFPTTPSTACPVCGESGILGRGDRAATCAELDTADLDLSIDLDPPVPGVHDAGSTWPVNNSVLDSIGAFFEHIHPN